MRYLYILPFLFAGPLAACPDKIIDPVKNSTLYETLLNAPDISAAQIAANALWDQWFQAPDQQAQDWLNAGVERIRLSDFSSAKSILTDLTRYCPNYAEGFNQLAFAQFLSNDFDASAENLKRSIALEPQHFGALAGLGLVAQKQNKLAEAKIWIRQALKVHPFLSERYILDIPEKTDDL